VQKKSASQSGPGSIGVLLALLTVLLPGNARGSFADSQPDRTAVTNGPVQAIVRAGDTIYIGGRFDRVGPRTGPGVEVALDGSQNPGLPEISGAGPSSILGSGGSLSAVAADGSGGWYIGGLFTHVGGVPRTNLAHIRADHSVDPSFNPYVNDAVHTLAVSGSTVYVAGLFTSIGGQTRNNIAALNAADGSVTAFNPNANAGVEALAISSDGSIIYAGGRFTMIGGLPRLSLAALNAADGSATLTFNPSVTGTVGNGVVNALARSGSTLYVGGSFNTIGGAMRNNIAALSLGVPLDGVAVPGFNPSPSYSGCAACGSIAALAVSSDGATVYAGGLFDTIGGKSRNHFAGLNPADGTATPFNPSPNGNIFTLAVSSDSSIIYVAGGFNSSNGSPSIGGQARNYAAAVNAIDGTATGFNPNPNAIVNAFGVSGSAVYLAGYFSSLGGVVRHSIAAISATDGSVTSFDPNAAGFNGGTATVYSLAVSGSTVYAGGYFGSIGGQSRTSIAALNTVDGSATSWDPSGHYFGGPAVVETLAVAADSTIYVGGIFTTIGGQTRNNIAALNASDGTATTWDPNPNSEVATLAVSGPFVYAGGFFTAIGGQTRNKIAALNASDGTATSWDPDATANANVLALAISGSTIYAGGNFPSIHGVPRQNIAGINISDGTPTSFDPQASDPSTGGGVYALAVSGSTVYAAGFFTSIGGQTRNLIAGLKSSDGTATSFDPNGAPGFGAFALAVASDGTLYVGGSFDTFDLAYQQGFAQFSPTLKLSSAVSRKTHGSAGTFDIDLPLTGPQGIECRSGGTNSDYTIVFSFANPLTSVGGASVTSGTGTVSTSAIGSDAHQYIVNLTGVANAQTITVSLASVNDSAGNSSSAVSASMGILLGDVNGNGTVSNTDIAALKSQVASPVTSSNFRNDVTANGVISNTDVSSTKAQVGTQLPP
jgi:trimeric autotransporter adhesin